MTQVNQGYSPITRDARFPAIEYDGQRGPLVALDDPRRWFASVNHPDTRKPWLTSHESYEPGTFTDPFRN